MKRAFAFSAALVFGLSGCTTGNVEIREIGSAHSDLSDGTTSGRVALGLVQLSQGNVGLALETFRRAVREDPQSYRALQGLAECYIQLGKPELARRSLEQAMALRPDVPELYRALAVSAQAEGKPQEAAALRREAVARANPVVAAKLSPPPPVPAKPALPPAETTDLAIEPKRDEGPRLVRLSLIHI